MKVVKKKDTGMDQRLVEMRQGLAGKIATRAGAEGDTYTGCGT